MPFSFSDFVSKASSSILLLGPPGVGKTVLASQFPQNYILECDNNIKNPTMWIQTQLKKGRKLRTDCEFDIPHLKDNGAGGFDLVPRNLRFDRYAELGELAAKAKNADGTQKYLTLTTDSITTWTDYVSDKVRTLQKKSIAGIAGAKQDDPLSQPDWGVFYGVAKNHIITCKSYNLRSIFIGHIDVREDETIENSKTLLKYLAFPGALRLQMAGLFDEVWMMNTRRKTTSAGVEYQRVLQTVPNDFREDFLGLKTGSEMGYTFVLDDFEKLTNLV